MWIIERSGTEKKSYIIIVIVHLPSAEEWNTLPVKYSERTAWIIFSMDHKLYIKSSMPWLGQ